MGWEAFEEEETGLDARLLDQWGAEQCQAPAAVPSREGLLARLTKVAVGRALWRTDASPGSRSRRGARSGGQRLPGAR